MPMVIRRSKWPHLSVVHPYLFLPCFFPSARVEKDALIAAATLVINLLLTCGRPENSSICKSPGIARGIPSDL